MPVESEKIRPREEHPGEGKVPQETPEKDRREIEEWFNKEGAFKSSADLKMIKNKIESDIKEGKGKPGSGGEFLSDVIKDELIEREGDDFWIGVGSEIGMDTKLVKLTNKWLELERIHKGNVPKDVEEAWERKHDELKMEIRSHREELKELKEKKRQSDIESIERI